ncbi:MAG: hypothetical protein AB7G87_04880 [Clostridia bacterium]
MLNSVLDTRNLDNGMHKMTLEIPEKEFEDIYGEYTNEAASEFLAYYMENRGDDGRPSDIEIKQDKNSHVVRIEANIHYLGNDHTSYIRE